MTVLPFGYLHHLGDSVVLLYLVAKTLDKHLRSSRTSTSNNSIALYCLGESQSTIGSKVPVLIHVSGGDFVYEVRFGLRYSISVRPSTLTVGN